MHEVGANYIFMPSARPRGKRKHTADLYVRYRATYRGASATRRRGYGDQKGVGLLSGVPVTRP